MHNAAFFSFLVAFVWNEFGVIANSLTLTAVWFDPGWVMAISTSMCWPTMHVLLKHCLHKRNLSHLNLPRLVYLVFKIPAKWSIQNITGQSLDEGLLIHNKSNLKACHSNTTELMNFTEQITDNMQFENSETLLILSPILTLITSQKWTGFTLLVLAGGHCYTWPLNPWDCFGS